MGGDSRGEGAGGGEGGVRCRDDKKNVCSMQMKSDGCESKCASGR